MGLLALALVCHALWVTCFALVLRHAFGRSLGTGVMVLCIPLYNVYYGFSQFEHRRKGPILAGWLGGVGLGVVLLVVAVQLTPGALPVA